MIYLSKEDILFINKEMILQFGGLFISGDNIANVNSLEYVLEAVKTKIFTRDLFPTIFDKAAAYAFYIIKDHIFHDGNKRTGMEAAFAFLERNGIFLEDSLSWEEIVSFAISIEEGKAALKEISIWFRKHAY